MRGFNPCFIGCYSLTMYRRSFWRENKSFNPCFIGCYSLTRRDYNAAMRDEFWFQSLFYWMLLSNCGCETDMNLFP